MNERTRSLMIKLVIVLGPVLLIMALLEAQMTTLAELDNWSMAIGIGAMVSLLIFLTREKKK